MKKLITILSVGLMLIPGSVYACREIVEEKVNICHATSSESHPWEAIEINKSAYDTHIEHGDFPYEGPLKDNGKPTKDGNAWCEENTPEEPEPCIYDEQLLAEDEKCVPPEEPETPVEPTPTPTPPAPQPAPQVESVTTYAPFGGK